MNDSSLELPIDQRSTTDPEATAPASATDASASSDPSADPSAALNLEAPEPIGALEPAAAEAAVPLDPGTVAQLDRTVAAYLEAVTSLDLHSSEFDAKVDEVRTLGAEDVRASAAVSNRLLQKPAAAMSRGGLSEGSDVSKALRSLRRQVEELDPARQGALRPRRILGVIPFGNRLRDYFARYQSSQGQLNAIIRALQDGQAELSRDNVAIEQEKASLWATIERLRQYAYLAQKLDAALAARIAEIEATDPDRARILREDFLFYVRQRVQDLLTQLAVDVQGYLALNLIRKNNLELIKGVDRATTTTISALRTAVIVAQALADQRLVLDQITALNSTTSELIESTSTLLRQQSTAVNEQATASTIDVTKLQAAFDNVKATIDEIDGFKLKALDSMARTVESLSTNIAAAQGELDRARTDREANPRDIGSS